MFFLCARQGNSYRRAANPDPDVRSADLEADRTSSGTLPFHKQFDIAQLLKQHEQPNARSDHTPPTPPPGPAAAATSARSTLPRLTYLKQISEERNLTAATARLRAADACRTRSVLC